MRTNTPTVIPGCGPARPGTPASRSSPASTSSCTRAWLSSPTPISDAAARSMSAMARCAAADRRSVSRGIPGSGRSTRAHSAGARTVRSTRQKQRRDRPRQFDQRRGRHPVSKELEGRRAFRRTPSDHAWPWPCCIQPHVGMTRIERRIGAFGTLRHQAAPSIRETSPTEEASRNVGHALGFGRRSSPLLHHAIRVDRLTAVQRLESIEGALDVVSGDDLQALLLEPQDLVVRHAE